MARKRFIKGRFVRIQLSDGSYAYGRLRRFPFAAFYNFQTKESVSDLDEIASKPILFTLAVHKSVMGKWEVIGKRPLEAQFDPHIARFRQSLGDFTKCTIFDGFDPPRKATPEECIGLERSSVWEARHVEQRLLDTFMGRPNASVERYKVRLK